jgi:hypothetical protein
VVAKRPLIVARIARGLHLANALEARVLQRAVHLDSGRRPGRARSAARAPGSPVARPVAEAEQPLAHLPTAEQIAAEIRRRPIGAVIADICRDLGILPSHPLWHDVRLAMIRHGGSYVRLVTDLIDRAFPCLPNHRPRSPRPHRACPPRRKAAPGCPEPVA